MLFCPHCQRQNPDDAGFCAFCGYTLTPLPEATERKTTASTPGKATVATGQSAISHAEAAEERIPNIGIVPLPTPTSTQTVPGAPGTTQINLPASAPGTPGTPGTFSAATGKVAQGSMGKTASGFLQTAAGKVIVGAIVAAVVVTAAVRAAPLLTKDTKGSQGASNVQQVHIKPTPRLTEKVPPTETSCPPTGQARPMVSAYLAQGKSDNLVYVDSSSGAPVLKRYDVKTQQTSTVITLPQSLVSHPQVSGNGQWVLFTSTPGNPLAGYDQQPKNVPTKVQMVRLDGQGLQTLYCSNPNNSLSNMVVSPDNSHIAFSEEHLNFDGQTLTDDAHLNILDTRHGSLYDAYPVHINGGGTFPAPLAWVDNTRLAVTIDDVQVASPVPPDGIYLMDMMQKRVYSSTDQLQKIPGADTPFDWSDAFSPDGKTLYTSQCPSGQYGIGGNGVSDIEAHPLTNGQSRTILSSGSQQSTPDMLITSIMAVTNTNIIFTTAPASPAGGPGGTNPNQKAGTWSVNLDGTGLKQLSPSQGSGFGQDKPASSWQAVSRDAQWYASMASQATTSTSSIQITSTQDGATPIKLATISNLNNGNPLVFLAGWTQM
ncbi:zinc-ribbon domain-containing protein [Ktedonobacter racemifer]|nr:zinc-ribbon domain-containing protein [Ktedonobacter racemifer]